MRVLVTGATTPLGTALVGELVAARDVELVLAVGREPESTLPTGPRLVYHSVDMTRARKLHDLLWGPARELAIDHVVHGMHHRRGADHGPAVHAQNVDATRELVLACMDHPTIRRLVYRSFAEVYALRHITSDLLDEEEPLDFDPGSPQWVRDRVEADLTVSTHLAGPLSIAVLRCAEILAAETGSQLWDYLQSRVCLSPLGYDPMLNVLSLEDAVAGVMAALRGAQIGVFNLPGYDTLPLSRAIAQSHRAAIPIPGPLIAPLYGLRRWVAGFEFRYDLNVRRFHFGGVLDGGRAREAFGFQPRTPVHWPMSWWNLLMARLAEQPVSL
ncbi:MAG: UDP-glucose 4-epimerase [Deltaproteobacteria bacterium]|nr:UDP-glucose 4-epimerase [Deltaproteobacteria bacterium]